MREENIQHGEGKRSEPPRGWFGRWFEGKRGLSPVFPERKNEALTQEAETREIFNIIQNENRKKLVLAWFSGFHCL